MYRLSRLRWNAAANALFKQQQVGIIYRLGVKSMQPLEIGDERANLWKRLYLVFHTSIIGLNNPG